MIRFDLRNILFKCCFRFKLCCFNSTSHTNPFKIISKLCGNFRNMLLLYNELWSNIDWCFIENFSSFREAHCFFDDRNQFFFEMFRFLMLFYLAIHKLFLLFKTFIRFIKLGLEFGLKEIFRRWNLRGESKHFIFNMILWELVWLHFLFSLELYQWFFLILILWSDGKILDWNFS